MARTHLDKKLQFLVHLVCRHACAPAEVNECLPDGEFAVQSDLLRHVTNPRPRHAGSFRSWSTTQDPDFAGIQSPAADDARQQSGLTATARTQQSVTM